MEKIQDILITKKVHHIYCDGCNKFLGSSQECDDGWYDQIGQSLDSIVFDKPYDFDSEKIYCDKCYQERNDFIKSVLKELINSVNSGEINP